MQHGVHGVRTVCAAVAVEVATESPPEYASTQLHFTEPPYWGDWQEWSKCSKKCGGGISYRKRRCYQSKCPDPYQKKCIGYGYEEKKCNEQCCPGMLITHIQNELTIKFIYHS